MTKRFVFSMLSLFAGFFFIALTACSASESAAIDTATTMDADTKVTVYRDPS